MSTTKPTLNEKLLEIYKAVDHFEKKGHNKQQNYAFLQSADVTRELRKQLVQFKIYAEINFDFAQGDYTIAREKAPNAPFTAANVKCSIVFHDLESNETSTGSGLGSGCDTSDKAVYKAQTGALKYALKNSFLVPDQADAEADETVDGGTQNNIPDDMPDFQESKHAEAKPGVPRTKKAEPTKTAQVARPTPAPAEAAPAGPPAANVPPAEAIAKPATVTPSTTEAETSKSATSTTPREPGDEPAEDRLPTEEEMPKYRTLFQKLGDELSTAEGGLKSSPKLPIERKLLVFLLKTTGAASPKEITLGQWVAFFGRIEAGKKNEQVGLKGITVLVNRASGIEPKEKK